MKISRLKPLLRALVVGKTRLKRNLLIFIICCAVKVWWFIRNFYRTYKYRQCVRTCQPHANLIKCYLDFTSAYALRIRSGFFYPVVEKITGRDIHLPYLQAVAATAFSRALTRRRPSVNDLYIQEMDMMAPEVGGKNW